MGSEGIKELFAGEFAEICDRCDNIYDASEIASLLLGDATPLRQQDVIIKPCGAKGKGLFANRDIGRGTIIDIAPVIVIPGDQYEDVENTILGNYLFNWNDEVSAGMCMSHCEFINHSYNPNTVYVRDFDGQVIIFRAIHDIKNGEEITTNYNGKVDDTTPLWFDVE
jgi:uncharacterized protein